MNKLKKWEIESIRDNYLKDSDSRDKNFDLDGLRDLYLSKRGDFQMVSKFDLNLGNKEVFLDEHDGSVHKGLKSSQLKFIDGKPVYLIDNHNKALQSFSEIHDLVKQKLNVVHIDAHRDDAVYPGEVEQIAEGNLQSYLDKTRVSDYLNVGLRGGIIEKVISVTQSSEFENFELPVDPFVLNLDIDIYGPEGTYVDTKLKTEVILKAWQNAEAIIFATSPGFISNEDVEDLADIFLI